MRYSRARGAGGGGGGNKERNREQDDQTGGRDRRYGREEGSSQLRWQSVWHSCDMDGSAHFMV